MIPAQLHPGVRLLCLLLALLPLTPLAAAATDIETVNQLISEGRLSDARTVLRAALITGTSEEKAQAAKMLEQLGAYMSERRATLAAPVATGRPATPDGTYAVTHLGGYVNGWIVVATRDSDFTTQRMSGFSAEFPKEWIRQQWEEELRITTLSGDAGGWCVVMSRTIGQKAPRQRYFGPGPVDDKMEAWIKQQAQEGLRITAVGGYGNQWVIVMTADTGWGTQRYLKPGKSEAEIAAWWDARQAEGYSITAMNGNFVFDRKTRKRTGTSFLIVATEGLNLPPQKLEVAVTRPKSGEINTDVPVGIVSGYGQNTDPFIVLRGGFPIEGSRQMVGTGVDCDKLISQVWNEFHELDEIAKQRSKTSGE